ncbi:hypothetical protein CQA66_08195 [Helicobacter aurati]|uniref:Uncharacterized protein n=1 Tax=Helicobacter aurati TaxID=137778 RepID=A0A3D8IYN7_9HELI|nr:hypothetical protein [Helicobacter aurati]RDU70378.1 hypothetical protein CQA66_08195 [Helicobacter aurati]
MAKYIQVPFAHEGDKLAFPFKPDGNSPIDFLRGYNKYYELPPDAGGEWINRENFNYLLNMITDTIQQLQRATTRDLDFDILQNGGYNVGEGCLLNYNTYSRQLIQTPTTYNNTESTYIQKIRVISLIPNNTLNPYSESALFDTWLIDDGNQIGFAYFDFMNLPAPPGYIRVNASDILTKQFSMVEYKRIRELLKTSQIGDKVGIFVKESDDTFSLQDIRGYHPRVWSNGSEVDSNRSFNELQLPALPNVKGNFKIANTQGGLDYLNGICQAWYNRGYPGAGGKGGSGSGVEINLSAGNPIYKDNINDVIPYNFNINILVKI